MVTLNYISWAIIACLAYSFVPPLVRLATLEVPSDTAAFMSNFVLVAVIGAVILRSGGNVTDHLWSRGALYLYVAGGFLGIGILAYYRALEAGPFTHVVPIFAMLMVGGSLLGFVFLGESLSVQNVWESRVACWPST